MKFHLSAFLALACASSIATAFIPAGLTTEPFHTRSRTTFAQDIRLSKKITVTQPRGSGISMSTEYEQVVMNPLSPDFRVVSSPQKQTVVGLDEAEMTNQKTVEKSQEDLVNPSSEMKVNKQSAEQTTEQLEEGELTNKNPEKTVRDVLATNQKTKQRVQELLMNPLADFKADGPMTAELEEAEMTNPNTEKVLMDPLADFEVDEAKPSGKESERPTDEVIQAAEQMVSMGEDERKRLDEVGNILLGVAATYAILASLFLDDGGLVGHLARFAVILPFSFGYGYKMSAKDGSSNRAQSGLWDVDENGLSKIEDPNLFRNFLEKVNAYDIETARFCALVSGAFALLPQSATSPAAAFAVLFAALYFRYGKLPKDS